MKDAFRYVLIGLFFATVVESINMGVLGGNWGGMVRTVLVVYSVFAFVGFRLRGVKPLVHLVVMGLIGLVGVEWFLIGTPPRVGDSFLSLFVFQLGIFLYWGTVGFAPRMFLDEGWGGRRGFLVFYLVWFGVVYLVGLFVFGGSARFGFMQVFSAVGHILLAWFYVGYIRG